MHTDTPHNDGFLGELMASSNWISEHANTVKKFTISSVPTSPHKQGKQKEPKPKLKWIDTYIRWTK